MGPAAARPTAADFADEPGEMLISVLPQANRDRRKP